MRLDRFFRYLLLKVYHQSTPVLQENNRHTFSDPFIEIINNLNAFQTALPTSSRTSSTSSRRILLPDLRQGFGEVFLYFESWLRHLADMYESSRWNVVEDPVL
jgi:hypothetical protein